MSTQDPPRAMRFPTRDSARRARRDGMAHMFLAPDLAICRRTFTRKAAT